MTEWKQSLYTTSEAEAPRKWVAENERYMAAHQAAEISLGGPQVIPPHRASAFAKQLTVDEGIHPDQAPALDASATSKEIEEFPQKLADWHANLDDKTGLISEHLRDNSIDEEQRQKDYDEGRWGTAGYQTPYKAINPDDPLAVAYAIAKGVSYAPSHATWRDAVELYIRTNKQEKKREPVKEMAWEKSTRQLLEKFAKHNGGMELSLGDLDRQSIRDWLWATWPKAGTRNRYNNCFSAVINCWNREMTVAVFNPFSGLSNKDQEKEEAERRRSFKPDEWRDYLHHVQSHHNIEIRLIGLLMLYTGCRTSEAAGLQVRDLKLVSNRAHVVYRTNRVRRMDKDGLERAVPLLQPLIDAFRDYDIPQDKEAPLFRQYGSTKGFESASAALRKVVRETMGLADTTVVPYSARHSLRDMSEAASGVTIARAEYIMGHVSEGSSKIHKAYGTKTPPDVLYDDMAKIFSVTDWGYYED
jgi:integrase